ncbi:tRNA adenosine(34) deaminase TadA [Kocuria massiliensis]|uniref:tRNA adenosine(34) deaminase TadA n=1 Tax=Kocuria massiliensis TaxID=1926282 RepID=UPI000A1CBA0B|nr:tRNA adenosine(34) deaminase TadA [Kocuria massiliensis]
MTHFPQLHDKWMGLALAEARKTEASADVPIGAIVVDSTGQIVGRGYNRREADGDPVAHAEVIALREAAAHLGRWRLDDCTLVVTLEPCTMCAGATLLARIPRLVMGAWDEKAGAVGSVFDVLRERRLNHWVEVFPEVRAAECASILREFFAGQRDLQNTEWKGAKNHKA